MSSAGSHNVHIYICIQNYNNWRKAKFWTWVFGGHTRIWMGSRRNILYEILRKKLAYTLAENLSSFHINQGSHNANKPITVAPGYVVPSSGLYEQPYAHMHTNKYACTHISAQYK